MQGKAPQDPAFFCIWLESLFLSLSIDGGKYENVIQVQA